MQTNFDLSEFFKKRESSFYAILFFVIICHFFLIFSSPTFEKKRSKIELKKEKRLTVQTVSLNSSLQSKAKVEAKKEISKGKSVSEAIPTSHKNHQENIKMKEVPTLEPLQKLKTTKVESIQSEKKLAPKSKKTAAVHAKQKPVTKKSETKKSSNKPVKEVVVKNNHVKETAKEEKLVKDQIKRKNLIANAQKSLATMAQSHDKLAITLESSEKSNSLPNKIDHLQVETLTEQSETTLTPREMTYYDELAGRLKGSLRLPEFGEVKIKLTLKRTGEFIKVMITDAKSMNNKKYLESTLPKLKYPSFGNNFNGMDNYTFVIALSNEL